MTDPERDPMSERVHEDAGAAARGQLRAVADELRALERGVRRDAPDSVHQARIRIRRLRSLLAVFEPVVGAGIAKPLDRALKLVGRQFGAARDAEVLVDFAEREFSAVSDARGADRLHRALIRRARARHRTRHERLVAQLDAGVFALLLDGVDAGLAAGGASPGVENGGGAGAGARTGAAAGAGVGGDAGASESAGADWVRLLQSLVDAQLGRALAQADAAGELAVIEEGLAPVSAEQFEQLHDARKSCRAVRYAAEATLATARAGAAATAEPAAGEERDGPDRSDGDAADAGGAADGAKRRAYRQPHDAERADAGAAVPADLLADVEVWADARIRLAKRVQDALGDHRDRSALARLVERHARRDRGRGKRTDAHDALALRLRARAAASLADVPSVIDELRDLTPDYR
ncbi:MAG: CHAD domain-containing protein [Pseudoclavibacter sp.]